LKEFNESFRSLPGFQPSTANKQSDFASSINISEALTTWRKPSPDWCDLTIGHLVPQEAQIHTLTQFTPFKKARARRGDAEEEKVEEPTISKDLKLQAILVFVKAAFELERRKGNANSSWDEAEKVILEGVSSETPMEHLQHFIKIAKNKKKKPVIKQTKKEKFIQSKLPILKELISENCLSMKKAAKVAGLSLGTATKHFKAWLRDEDGYSV